MWLVIVYLLFGDAQLVLSTVSDRYENVINERDTLFKKEIDMMLGSDIVLSDSEEKVNEIIIELKHRELDTGLLEPGQFNVSKHFFEYKETIKETNLFKIIKRMPKGAILHAHDIAILSPDYVLGLTYSEKLYVCFEEDDVRFLFSKDIPKDTCGTRWQLLRDARFSSGNVEKFDAELKKYFTIVIDNPEEVYTDINIVWSIFQDYFVRFSGIISYKPVWEKYFYDALKALRDDNIMYLEIRSTLPQLYDLEGNVFDSLATAQSYKDVSDKFVIDYPDFYGVKLIYSPLRLVDYSTVKSYIEIAKNIDNKIPGFLAGFDLVGQEDLGAPIKYFLPQLVEAGKYLKFFFHAGETNWNGMSPDENIFDAIVLGTQRIGHGFALAKHPVLIEEIKKRDIAIEVNVISNAVLGLVKDVRNHPLSSYLAQNLPVVLSCDDPGAWEADPLSHDFYVTFVGVANRHADLKLLKKLALNSLYYSTLKDKDKIIHEFEIRWIRFIDSILKGNY
ncbi:adenosine deaminase AGSA-like [Achroia grisella]|uniref:adenosine deaminase AGSA-like n=1 Tax=Achroia grisella TaxID=688607 RepID=UPI0027D29199|nr:adenosine deaminase AGSA-like [Achroia grisella]